ncbi:MIT domain-containing protein 1 [Harpegnathos saltator]|uniref:MIT domain-containing protein 1 n=1 Tax=Harpegnathos saltator TaxID=610380 RepID=E2BFI2_HARSA|nr:MIT domain-containing protein 1 [Harpegnathos saltator]XP_011137807.1 MIT domain-containing protein 1 [Harpegnathos saltator]XP_011137808.1 MIT domain-containing protein 1 [Harpegnathos saltator]XP_011137809.1 MIT domain-containing protein 1 [Harpegnathos saltator]XP_011137810.1 MIT domain-containing protein 1 [Harpegnathos saltator]XP_025159294.1 MIT domain-containing protein 1 [Harpegnathos saltator]EFN85504.1 MIT domain-containing protein 1 [Harpegnathos saltator]
MELAAVSVLTRAVEMDEKEQYTMALVLYEEGVQILLNVVKETKEAHKRGHFTIKAKEYLDRAEKVKKLINARKLAGSYRESMKIESGSTGYSYATVFGRFLDSTVTHISIEDPYIRAFHQCQNLVRLCELAVQKCCKLSRISLLTTYDIEDNNQITRLAELKESLASRKISFDFSFSETLHDRKISLSNGWVIKIGRGLDYFRAPNGKFVLGTCDLELRPCLETTVDIFHKSDLQDGS